MDIFVSMVDVCFSRLCPNETIITTRCTASRGLVGPLGAPSPTSAFLLGCRRCRPTPRGLGYGATPHTGHKQSLQETLTNLGSSHLETGSQVRLFSLEVVFVFLLSYDCGGHNGAIGSFDVHSTDAGAMK